MSLMVKAARAQTGTSMPGRGPTGDPGLFGFLKGVGKTALSLVTGGPSAAVGTAIGQITGGSSRSPRIPSGSLRMAAPPPPRPVQRVPGVRGAAQRLLPGGATGFQVNGSGAVGTQLACPGGFHPNKSDYFLRDGTFIPKGSKCVKNRRRNPMNPRALRRAVSRVEMGKRWQGKLAEISTGRYTKAGHRKD